MAVTRSRLAIVAVVLVTLAILVRGHSDDDTPTATTLQTPIASFHARTRAPALSVANASIAGTIRDDHGGGLAGARVCERNFDMPELMVCASADAHGAYRVDAIVPGQLDVWASARGRRPESYEPRVVVGAGDHRDHIDLVLHTGGVEVHGTISAVGGHAIAGARVEIGGLETRTDDAGHYSMWVRPSWAVIMVSADHYANAFRGGPAPGQLDLALSPGSRLTGIVVDDAGAPVTGATVMANHADMVRDGTAWNTQPVRSDERGHFALTGMLPGRYEISAREAHGYGMAIAVPLAPGTQVDGVVVRLARGFELVGQVTTPEGATCRDAGLWLEDKRGRTIPSTRDGDGTLHVGGLVAGTYAVYPSCAEHLTTPEPKRIAIADHDVEASWSVEEGATIRGRITTSRGRAVSGVDIYVTGHGPHPSDPELHQYAASALDGSYVVHGLPAGRYEITAKGWSSPTSPVQLKATVEVRGDETVSHDFQADEDAVGSFSGHVVDTEGHVPQHLNVALQPAKEPQALVATVDDGGNFSSDGIPVGTYTVTVFDDDGQLTIVDAPITIQIRSGEAATTRLVVTQASGVIRGRVVDDLGEPAAGVGVALAQDGDASVHFESSLQTTTDADGRFAVTHLGPYKYKVRAFRREGVDVALRGVSVGDLDVLVFDRADMTVVRNQTFPMSDGHFEIVDLAPGDYMLSVNADGSHGDATVTVERGGHANVDVALPDRVTLVGRVVEARTGRPIAGMALSASRTDDSASNVTTTDDGSRVTDADGRFTIVGVPRGMLTISSSTLQDSNTGSVDVHRDTSTGGDVIDIGVVYAVAGAYNATAGCGCVVTVGDNGAIVDAVSATGAAAQAGLVTGDIITAVGGVDTTGDHAGLASLLLSGDADTSVEVTLQSGVTLTLVRT